MANKGFLLAEDAALKARFSTLTVSDDRNNARPVQVFFRYPENETERNYPFVTIEMIDLVHAKNRQHSETQVVYPKTGIPNRQKFLDGPDALKYWPSRVSDMETVTGTDTGDPEFIVSNEFVPVDLLYQVSTFTRSALHDRQLSAQMLSTITPFRKGFIDVPEDGTIRRLDLLDWTTADLLDSEAGYRKRIFRKIYTLQMSAEIPSVDMYGLQQVTSVITTTGFSTSTP
jgi:hypothetical protein